MDGRYLLLLRGFSLSVPLPRLIFVPQNEWMGLAIHSVASILAKYRVLWTQNEQMGIPIHSVASFSENTRSPTHQGRLWFRRYPRTTAGAPKELQLMDGRYLLLLRGFSLSVPLPRLIFVPQNEWMGLAIHSVASILAKYRVLWTQNEQMGIPIHSVASKQAASQPASKPSRIDDYLTLSSAVRRLPSAVCRLPSAVRRLPSAVCRIAS